MAVFERDWGFVVVPSPVTAVVSLFLLSSQVLTQSLGGGNGLTNEARHQIGILLLWRKGKDGVREQKNGLFLKYLGQKNRTTYKASATVVNGEAFRCNK